MLAPADHLVIDAMLKPARLADFSIVFASGRMVLAYLATDARAKGLPVSGSFDPPSSVPQVAAGWFDVLTAPGVRISGAHPFMDPGGYRAHMIFELAQAHYKVPGLQNALLQHYQVNVADPVLADRRTHRPPAAEQHMIGDAEALLMNSARSKEVGVRGYSCERQPKHDRRSDVRRAKPHARRGRIGNVGVCLERVTGHANGDIVTHASRCHPPIHIGQVTEYAEPRREAAGQRRGVIAHVVGERIHLRADVALDELIERTDAQAPVAVQVVPDADLRDARLEIDAGLPLSVSLTCRIGGTNTNAALRFARP